jgi:hypothetical protein
MLTVVGRNIQLCRSCRNPALTDCTNRASRTSPPCHCRTILASRTGVGARRSCRSAHRVHRQDSARRAVSRSWSADGDVIARRFKCALNSARYSSGVNRVSCSSRCPCFFARATKVFSNLVIGLRVPISHTVLSKSLFGACGMARDLHLACTSPTAHPQHAIGRWCLSITAASALLNTSCTWRCSPTEVAVLGARVLVERKRLATCPAPLQEVRVLVDVNARIAAETIETPAQRSTLRSGFQSSRQEAVNPHLLRS